MNFTTDIFWAFKSLFECKYENIHLKCIPNLNFEFQHLTFEINGQHIWVVHHDLKTLTPTFVIGFIFVVVESLVKNQCKGKLLKLHLLVYLIFFFKFVEFCFIFMLLQGLLETWLQVWLSKVVLLLCNVDVLARAAKTLIQELETRFPAHGLMDVLGIVYPKYWLQVECETSFPKKTCLIKTFFCSSKTQLSHGVETFVLEVLNASDLDS